MFAEARTKPTGDMSGHSLITNYYIYIYLHLMEDGFLQQPAIQTLTEANFLIMLVMDVKAK